MSIEKLTIVRLGGKLGQKFGKTHRFYVSSAAEAVRMMSVQFEGFNAYLSDETNQTLYKVFVNKSQIDPEKELHMSCNPREVRISPVPQGAKRAGLFQAIVGVVLIAASWYMGGAAGWAYLGAQGMGAATMAFSVGVSMLLGGVASLLSPQPQLSLSDPTENTPNKNFSGPVNTISAGRPVPIAYGRVMAGSATISAGVYTSDTNY